MKNFVPQKTTNFIVSSKKFNLIIPAVIIKPYPLIFIKLLFNIEV